LSILVNFALLLQEFASFQQVTIVLVEGVNLFLVIMYEGVHLILVME